MFNTLKYAKKLESVGLSREQAEAHIQILSEVMEDTLATKQDVKDLRNELRESQQLLSQEMLQLEQRMTIKLGTIVSIAIGVAVALAKLA